MCYRVPGDGAPIPVPVLAHSLHGRCPRKCPAAPLESVLSPRHGCTFSASRDMTMKVGERAATACAAEAEILYRHIAAAGIDDGGVTAAAGYASVEFPCLETESAGLVPAVVQCQQWLPSPQDATLSNGL